MPSEKPSTDRRRSSRRQSDRTERSLAEQLVSHTLDPLAVVMLTRDRIQETLEEAVERGRVTRSDANDLAGELVRRGRQQTEELLVEIERALEGGRGRLESGGKRSRLTEGVGRLARTAERARRSVTGGDGFPISDYGELTARQVQSRLGDLDESELRQVREHERRHANRKTVLDAIERALS